jgi:hypothetical protein
VTLNRATWPQLVEVHLIAVNDILGNAGACEIPRWMASSFGPGSPAAEGRETSIYFSRPSKPAELDGVLGDFLGQIRANLRTELPADAASR